MTKEQVDKSVKVWEVAQFTEVLSTAERASVMAQHLAYLIDHYPNDDLDFLMNDLNKAIHLFDRLSMLIKKDREKIMNFIVRNWLNTDD